MKIHITDKFRNVLLKKHCDCELSFTMSRYVTKIYMYEVHELIPHYKEYAPAKLNFNAGKVEYYFWEQETFDLLRCVTPYGRIVYVKLPDTIKKTFRKKLKTLVGGRNYARKLL